MRLRRVSRRSRSVCGGDFAGFLAAPAAFKHPSSAQSCGKVADLLTSARRFQGSTATSDVEHHADRRGDTPGHSRPDRDHLSPRAAQVGRYPQPSPRRQRSHRIVLVDHATRTPRPLHLALPGGAVVDDVRLDRGILQPHPPPSATSAPTSSKPHTTLPHPRHGQRQEAVREAGSGSVRLIAIVFCRS